MNNKNKIDCTTTPIEWLMDAEKYYIASRCLVYNNMLDAGFFIGCRSIEKYLKTLLLLYKNYYIKSHDLNKLYNEAINEKIIHREKELESYIKYFNDLKNNFAYVEGAPKQKRKKYYSYRTQDINRIDKIVFEIESRLWSDDIINAYTYPRTDIITIREIIENKHHNEAIINKSHEKWLFHLNKYIRKK